MTEGTTKVTSWEKNNRRNFAVPIHETDVEEPFYSQLVATFKIGKCVKHLKIFYHKNLTKQELNVTEIVIKL